MLNKGSLLVMAATSTAAPSEVLLSTHGKENFQRIARLLICGGTKLLREKFDHIHDPRSLTLKLKNPVFKTKLKDAKLTKPQKNCLYPTISDCGTSADFDISLLFKLLKTICNLNPPATGWDVLPADTDHSLSAELVRIKVYRNQLFHDYPDLEVSDEEFRSLWKSVSSALEGVASSLGFSQQHEWKKAINKLLTDPLTSQDVKELRELYENDLNVAKVVKQLEVSFQGGMECVQEQLKQTEENVQEQLKQTGENLQEQIKKTGENVQHVQEQLKQTGESIVRQIQETIVKEISRSSLTSPERQPNVLLRSEEQRALADSSAGTSGAYQSSQVTVQALETSTQIGESPSRTPTSAKSEFINVLHP